MADENHVGRDYLVLQATDDDLYTRLPDVTATSAEQAVRRAATGLDNSLLETGVQLIVIPVRNWTVINVRLERKERLVTE